MSAEVLQYTGLSNFSEVRWWNVGRTKLEGEDLNYFGIEGLRIAGGQGIMIIAICQVCSRCKIAWDVYQKMMPVRSPATLNNTSWADDACQACLSLRAVWVGRSIFRVELELVYASLLHDCTLRICRCC